MSQPESTTSINIAVLGVTGAGKTSFISKATGKDGLAISDGLDSCTQNVETIDMNLDGKHITLIDTPGFDDTFVSDADILERVANFLVASYKTKNLLTGVILLQPINHTRLQGSEKSRTRLFKKILGEDAYSRVVIGTTMWNLLPSENDGMKRMEERKARPDAWGDMVSKGAQVTRHDDNQESAHTIIRAVMRFDTPVSLQLQVELEKSGGKIADTSAGKQLLSDYSEKIEELQRRIDEMIERNADEEERRELEKKKEQAQRDKEQVQNGWVNYASLGLTALSTLAVIAGKVSKCSIM